MMAPNGKKEVLKVTMSSGGFDTGFDTGFDNQTVTTDHIFVVPSTRRTK